MARPTEADWELIEAKYRTGQLSIREIARQHGIAASSITRRSNRDQWTRDLTEEVNQKTKRKMLEPPTIPKETEEDLQPVKPKPVSEQDKEAVDLAVKTNVEAIRSHLASLKKGRSIIDMLSSELVAVTCSNHELQMLIEEATKEDRNPRDRNAMKRAISLPQRAGTIRDLSAALRNFIALERQALNMEGRRDEEDGGFDKFYKQVCNTRSQRLSDMLKAKIDGDPEDPVVS